jgi:aspartyl-tRNA(Asn)/glutamyl-tRNA(Gln) amidotransferase subunit A
LDLGYAAVDPEVAQITSEAAKVFYQLGCTVEEPDFQLENPTPAFMDIFYTNNCVSYGHLLPEHADELSDNGRFCLEHGVNVTGVELAQALRFVEVMRGRLDDLMESYDLLLTPTMAVPPFPVGQLPDRIGGQEVYPRGGYTPFTRAFNLSGQPAASIPCGFSAEGLPIGLHIIGRRGEEATVLKASAAFEEARPWAQRRPSIE